MACWSIEFLLAAEKDLAQLDAGTRRRIIEKLEWFQDNFDSVVPITLMGEFRAFYKLRIGDWRVFYKINHTKQTIVICYIDRRDKAYKKMS